jgi:hypothetical protein
MTLEQRNAAILKVLAEQTKAMTASPEAARKALIKEGIYTAKGNLRAKFGGGKAKTAA